MPLSNRASLYNAGISSVNAAPKKLFQHRFCRIHLYNQYPQLANTISQTVLAPVLTHRSLYPFDATPRGCNIGQSLCTTGGSNKKDRNPAKGPRPGRLNPLGACGDSSGAVRHAMETLQAGRFLQHCRTNVLRYKVRPVPLGSGARRRRLPLRTLCFLEHASPLNNASSLPTTLSYPLHPGNRVGTHYDAQKPKEKADETPHHPVITEPTKGDTTTMIRSSIDHPGLTRQNSCELSQARLTTALTENGITMSYSFKVEPHFGHWLPLSSGLGWVPGW
jgi:hypothetical protein